MSGCSKSFEVPREEIERLVSLPPAAAAWCAASGFRAELNLFISSDPPGTQLGSGGGSASLLASAHRSRENAPAFDAWLACSRKLLIHGSGESRRLPGYAVLGKPLIPVPQRLLDLQIESYSRLFWHAPPSLRVMVTSGDVLLETHGALPVIPEADVVLVGIRASEEEAQHHGVMVCPKDNPGSLESFLQKPSIDQLRSLAPHQVTYLDTGVWMLSRRAVHLLMKKSGWKDVATGRPKEADRCRYELYAQFGLSLGRAPQEADDEISALRCAVLPLPEGRFYHFGSSRSLLNSVAELLSPAVSSRSFGQAARPDHAAAVVVGADDAPAGGWGTGNIWMDHCDLPTPLRLAGHHVCTQVPCGQWLISLSEGVCLDYVPLSETTGCLRPYGIDDSFRGSLNAADTTWMGRSVTSWMEARDIRPEEAGFSGAEDIQESALFPVVSPATVDVSFVEWLTATAPARADSHRDHWLRAGRRSAADLLLDAAPEFLLHGEDRIDVLRENPDYGTEVDLLVLATSDSRERRPDRTPDPVSMGAVHARMLRAEMARRSDPAASERFESEAFGLLRDLIVNRLKMDPVAPARNVMDDQIVWGRSPVRLDLAGGWTDTPPYCLEFGGSVVNVAVDLNGQSPIQVFVRMGGAPRITIRSIDLDMEEVVETYEGLQDPGHLGSGFGIVKCALALAGFSPRFHASGGYPSLREQLEKEVGGGLALTTLAAVPKGSGLGTSSILAATVLGTLSDALSLAWKRDQIFQRTLALEQLLGAGGGWQDQVGGIESGLKWITTEPGPAQEPDIQWLPHGQWEGNPEGLGWLLYYTGLTRVAHDVLNQIVHGMFLNDRRRHAVLEEIGWNAAFAARAIQHNDRAGVCEALRRSWQLNQRLDEGTNTPQVQAIIDAAGDGLDACKLLGAGGGGYMLMLARDPAARAGIQERLTSKPSNARARFIAMNVSESGMQVTRS